MRKILPGGLLWLALALMLAAASGPYLLMSPIEEAVKTGDFAAFGQICPGRVSVNLELPFDLAGYFAREKFIRRLRAEFSLFKAERIEWISLQIEDEFAVQSLNLILKNTVSGSRVYYKLVFFLTKRDRQWKLYYLRGLSL